MTIYERIRNRRKELNLSADSVAEALGVSRATIYRYESSEIEKLPTSILAPLSKVLQTTPAYLMGWEDTPALSSIEISLLNKFNKLNNIGKDEAIKRVDELTYINKYINKDYLTPIAAHADNEKNIEILKEDIDMIKGEDW